jgi:hypothetical protein
MPLTLRSQSATRQFEVEAQRSVAISAHVAGKAVLHIVIGDVGFPS